MSCRAKSHLKCAQHLASFFVQYAGGRGFIADVAQAFLNLMNGRQTMPLVPGHQGGGALFVIPPGQAGVAQAFPGECGPGILFALWCYIAMPHYVQLQHLMSRDDIPQQSHQGGDLLLGIGLPSIAHWAGID